MARLPNPARSYAILIGTGVYESAGLPNLPSVRNNLSELKAALTDPAVGGIADERCVILADSGSVREVYRTLREYAARAEDTLIIYFAGHGLTGPVHNDLYLALADTDVDELRVSALSFDLIRDVFADCPAMNRVLILDCCFSGRAAQGFMTDPDQTIAGQIEVAGTYTLAATSATTTAIAPPGATYTAFTGELLSLLHNGIPGGPELLTLGTIYRRLRHVMATRRLPLPTQRGTNTADLLALARNRAYRPDPTPPTDASAVRPPRRPAPTRTSRLALVIGAVVIVAGSVTAVVLNVQSNRSDATSPSTTRTTHPTTATSSSSPAPTTPADPRAVRVYNNGTVAGLGTQAARDFTAGGWNATGMGNYLDLEGIIPTSTVFFRPGTEEEAAARELATRFGMRAEPRFSGIADAPPGLIVMITNDYGGR